MAGVLPELSLAKKVPELPELTQDLKAAELLALEASCGPLCKRESSDKTVLFFQHTQTVHELGSVRQLVTSCAVCGGRRHLDCK